MYVYKREDGTKGPVFLCGYKRNHARNTYYIWVSPALNDATTFQSPADASNYIQPLIKNNHPSIHRYELIQIDGDDTDTPEDAYDRAMGVL